MGFGNYSFTEIFSVMDKVSLDFYAPDTEHTYLKTHINEILDHGIISYTYQDQTTHLPNVYFQILERYFADHNIKFNNVIATSSTSVDGMPMTIYDRKFILGYEFSKTWWYYISIYSVLVMAKQLDYNIVYSNSAISQQLQILSNKCEIDGTFISLDQDKKILRTL